MLGVFCCRFSFAIRCNWYTEKWGFQGGSDALNAPFLRVFATIKCFVNTELNIKMLISRGYVNRLKAQQKLGFKCLMYCCMAKISTIKKPYSSTKTSYSFLKSSDLA